MALSLRRVQDLRLVPDDGNYGDPLEPADQLPASGYAIADASGTKLSWEQLTTMDLVPFGLELDTPWDERLRDHRFDPGQLLKLTYDPKARPLPKVRVWDGAGSWRIGCLGVSYWGMVTKLLDRWRDDDPFSALVLTEGIWQGVRIHETVLVGPAKTISELHRSLVDP